MKRIVPTSLLLAGLLGFGVAHAQAFPMKPVKMVVPTGLGGGTDNLARLVSQKLSEKWGHIVVVVENRPGAKGITGTQDVVRVRNDGSELLLVPSGHTLNPTIRISLPYDTLKDLSPITMIGQSPLALAVGSKVPAKELATLAKAQPVKLSHADPVANTPDAFGKWMTSDIERSPKILKAADVKPE